MPRDYGPSTEDIEFKADAEDETKQNSNFYIGVTRDSAGNRDYSKAAVWRLSPTEREAFQQGKKRMEHEKTEARRNKLEIPPEVLPGTSTMVRYRLRNARILKEEKLDQPAGNAQERVRAEVEQYKDEETMIEDLEWVEWQERKQGDWEKEHSEFPGFNTTKEEIEATSIPAAKMVDLVDQLVEKWEDLARENPALNKVSIGHGGSREIDYTRFLREANDLKLRLVNEDLESQGSKKQ